ncbi:hypothetical protein, unlikely [Trypanosoma brucei gambiense DAL972]|uniref:Uncharacterized protein n=1 Tax=Trypanosoma brucei gambiense (strain MHOM/CI/86/DAL972) TaxID=679716 RepID=C9ZSV4_TRYB9|nr:hypothetical protein, unlikely [Trypanosoma brucei gambiense DAL972]CBH12489.1 hypothetical protein, unlikely [Trypanosoma brucei gambiense DAL972]|eukprot:XP_011774769.1 hypothetical protein, unlikely [Trypanosoma brucei gambiense DAL972]
MRGSTTKRTHETKKNAINMWGPSRTRGANKGEYTKENGGEKGQTTPVIQNGMVYAARHSFSFLFFSPLQTLLFPSFSHLLRQFHSPRTDTNIHAHTSQS